MHGWGNEMTKFGYVIIISWFFFSENHAVVPKRLKDAETGKKRGPLKKKVKYSLLVSGRCRWHLRACSPSPPLVPPPWLHSTLPPLPPSRLLSSPPLPTPSSTRQHFLSPHPRPESSAFGTLRRLPCRFRRWVNPETACTKPAAHPKTWRTPYQDLQREKTLLIPHHFLLLSCSRLWTITRGTAAAIILRYKAQGRHRGQQPRKREYLGTGGFGAAARTCCPKLRDLRTTTHRTGWYRQR